MNMIEMTLEQLRNLNVGEKVWVKVIVGNQEKATLEVDVDAVDEVDDLNPVRVMLPMDEMNDLGIQDVIERRGVEYYGKNTYWVDNLDEYLDHDNVRIVAVAKE